MTVRLELDANVVDAAIACAEGFLPGIASLKDAEAGLDNNRGFPATTSLDVTIPAGTLIGVYNVKEP